MYTIQFGDSVKYFRRLSYKYGPDAYTIVLCANQTQRRMMAQEAICMMEGSSLDFGFDSGKMQLSTLRGSVMRFRLAEGPNWEEHVRGTYPTQIILPSSMPEAQITDITERLRPYMGRNSAIDSADERVDIVSV